MIAEVHRFEESAVFEEIFEERKGDSLHSLSVKRQAVNMRNNILEAEQPAFSSWLLFWRKAVRSIALWRCL
jgi:hypothetical protein